MAQIKYPTIDLIESFIQGEYNQSISPTAVEPVLGNTVGNYTDKDNGKYHVICLPIQKPLIGIDIPVLINESQPAKGTIAIIAQDPLRNDKDKMLPQNPSGNTIIGTPFALHYTEKCYPQTAVYRRIIEKLLTKGYDIYITDARKIYPKDKGLKGKEIDLLIREINRIKPRFVITLGSTANDYLDIIVKQGLNTTVINLLHPSQQNWDHWKQWIFEQAYFEKVSGRIEPYTRIANRIPKRDAMFDDQITDMPKLIAELVSHYIP